MKRLLELAVAIGLVAFGAGTASAQPPASVAEQYLLAAANAERAQLNLPPLVRDPALVQAARAHARLMAEHGTISHQFAGEQELAARGSTAGARFSVISENVAMAADAVTTHDAWMHSPGHKANLLDARVDSVGIAVIQRGRYLYSVEDFSRSVQVLSLDQQEAQVGNLLAGSGVVVRPPGDEIARRTCALSTGYAGSRRPWFVMRFTAGSLDRLPEALKERLSTGTYHEAAIGACDGKSGGDFSMYSIAVLLYP